MGGAVDASGEDTGSGRDAKVAGDDMAGEDVMAGDALERNDEGVDGTGGISV
jgi:hypothetical protein